MRRLSLLAIPVSLFAFMACSSSDEPSPSNPANGDSGSDTFVPDTTPPADGGDDAAVDSAEPDAPIDAPTSKPESWDTDYALPGISGESASHVLSMVVTSKRWIYAGGKFHHAGSVPANNVAVWNGLKWIALGSGLPGTVEALTATPTDEVYAVVDKDSSSHLYYWDKSTWTDVGASPDGRIQSIDVAADGTLWVAGWFTKIGGKDVPGVARYKSGTWSTVGTLTPTSLEVVRVTTDGACVGGSAEPGEAGVSCWNGTTWTSRRGNLDRGTVKALRVDSKGTLYAAGEFWTGPDDGPGSIARWTGTAWELVGGGVTNIFGGPGNVTDLAISGDKVYVGGRIVGAGAINVRHLAMWDGKKWFDLDGGLAKHFGVSGLDMPLSFALAVDDGGELYVGGSFTRAGGKNAMYLARNDGSTWNAVDDPLAIRRGINGYSNVVLSSSDGKSTYVGGAFAYLGGDVAASNVARLDALGWHPLAAGLDDEVRAMAIKDGDLYAVGRFRGSGTSAGGDPVVVAKSIARFNGTAWSGVGGGLDGTANAIAIGPDGKLVVGGEFETAGTLAVGRVATWDGSKWGTLGKGVSGEGSARVGAIAILDGKTYVAGQFTKAGDVAANNVAVWDGTNWAALGEGLDDTVYALAVYGGKLVAGGYFKRSGTTSVKALATWDGSKWVEIGGGLSPAEGGYTVFAQALAARGTELFVGGLVEVAGTTAVSHVARWDGTTWSNLKGGVDDTVGGLHVGSDSLWVAGTFSSAGGNGSVGLARYWFGK